MDAKALLAKLWEMHTQITPSALEIKHLFDATEGSELPNDHIALRTFQDQRVGIKALEQVFTHSGYVAKDTYNFEAKKLFAQHYEHPDPAMPKVFISELLLQEFSPFLQETVNTILNSVDFSKVSAAEMVKMGRPWGLASKETYDKLRDESEYAAWLYVFGYRANHFTVDLSESKAFPTLQKANTFLEEKGFTLNASGGKVKGTPEQLLEQSSVLADVIEVEFQEGIFKVPSCYYEFAKRYKMPNGEFYGGFVAQSADKIFESTDFRKK